MFPDSGSLSTLSNFNINHSLVGYLMAKIKIALVGRPNVGKSALFNRIIQKHYSIVDEMEGVTRDRLYGEGELFGRPFEAIDTGGIDLSHKLLFAREVKYQAEIAIEEADSLILVVDGKVGITSLDQDIFHLLKKRNKPLCLAINKIDFQHQEFLAFPFYQLGIQDMISTSAIQGRNIVELLEKALFPCKQEKEMPQLIPQMKVSIIGRANVGKSTLINALLDENRCVVSPLPGTTRDQIDVQIAHGNQKITFIDTAGIRRKKAEHEVVDKFAHIRTQKALERSDICLLVLDAQEGLTHQEKRLITLIEKEGKSCLIFFNKWDLTQEIRMEHCYKSLTYEASFIQYCPIIFGSAKTKRHLDKIFPTLQNIFQSRFKRIPTGKLNQFIGKAMQKNHPPSIQGKPLHIYFLSQIQVSPPTFLLFVNDPKKLTPSYQKYLMNQLRLTHPFLGTPFSFHLKGKKEKPKKKKAKKILPKKHRFQES